MITKRERKLYAWLAQGRITQRQLLRRPGELYDELQRLMYLNGWEYQYLPRVWYSPEWMKAVEGCSREWLALVQWSQPQDVTSWKRSPETGSIDLPSG